MEIDKVPIIGKINRILTSMMLNFILLAVITLILGISVLFFPKVLDVLVSALLILMSLIFLNIAYHVYSYKKKYSKWFK